MKRFFPVCVTLMCMIPFLLSPLSSDKIYMATDSLYIYIYIPFYSLSCIHWIRFMMFDIMFTTHECLLYLLTCCQILKSKVYMPYTRYIYKYFYPYTLCIII